MAIDIILYPNLVPGPMHPLETSWKLKGIVNIFALKKQDTLPKLLVTLDAAFDPPYARDEW